MSRFRHGTEPSSGTYGNVRTKRVGGATGGATTTFVYDNRGRLTGVTDAMNRTESFTYDTNSLVLTRTDRNGTQFRNTHDNMGRVGRPGGRQAVTKLTFHYENAKKFAKACKNIKMVQLLLSFVTL